MGCYSDGKGPKRLGIIHWITVLLLFLNCFGHSIPLVPPAFPSDEETSNTKSRSYCRPSLSTCQSNNPSLRSPSQLFSLLEKAQELLPSQTGDSSFLARLEQEAKRQSSLSNSTTRKQPLTWNQYQRLALVFPLMYIGPILQGAEWHDILSRSLSTLALVWLPALLMQAGWLELSSCLFLLATQPTIRTFAVRELIPQALTTLEKLCWSEVWKRMWNYVLEPLPKQPLLVPWLEEHRDWDRLSWLPSGMKRALKALQSKVDSSVQSIWKSSIQKSLQGQLRPLLFDTVSSTLGDATLMYYFTGQENAMENEVGSEMRDEQGAESSDDDDSDDDDSDDDDD